MELNKEEYNWTEQAVIGMALLIQGGSIDSFGNQINGNIFYEVGKHKESGMVAILPTERNQKEETKKKISESNIGNKISEETKKKISKAILGTKHSEESRRKNSEAHKGINTWMKGTKMSEYNKLKLVETNSIPILQFDKQGNFIKEWKSAAEAGKQLNINYTHISSCVRKDKHRKTAGGYKWELKIIEKYDRNIK